jgi:microcompartment protein CcmL/EutN
MRKEKIRAAYVAIMIRGDVAAVEAAIGTGQATAAAHGKVSCYHECQRSGSSVALAGPE